MDTGTLPTVSLEPDASGVRRLAATRGEFAADQAHPEQGAQIGRYVVLHKLGAGAMGVVLAAYDPELDRRVALKLLHGKSWSTSSARARLVREAKVLAQLSHPNVVAVHDTGTHEGEVYIAMEFVQGQTLRTWLATQSRDWRAVLEAFIPAALGLQAAHAIGLVHRDFKPENIMLGDDGRVRVMDFGLARHQGFEAPEPAPHEVESTEPGDAPGRLSATGMLMGTPLFMAPEQFALQDATHQSDQFSFCASLYAALFGTPPFAGAGVREIHLAQTLREFASPRTGQSTPPWLREVVLRGLAAAPRDRYPDMAALLRALDAGARRRRRRVVGMSAGGLLTLALAIPAAQYIDERGERELCTSNASYRIDEVWSAAKSKAARNALVGTDLVYAGQTAGRVVPLLDNYREVGRNSIEQLCVRTKLESSLTPQEAAKASWCIEEREATFAAVANSLLDPGPSDVQNAVSRASSLVGMDACLDARSLALAAAPPSTRQREMLIPLRKRITALRHQIGAGEYAQALQGAEELLPQAKALGWGPLIAGTMSVQAQANSRLGNYTVAEELFTSAYMTSMESEDWRAAAGSASALGYLTGYQLARPDDAGLWARHAATAIKKAGDPLGLLEARRQLDIGNVQLRAEHYALALTAFDRALQGYLAAYPPDHLQVALVRSNLAATQSRAGDMQAAIANLQASLQSRTSTLGTQHPLVGETLINLGDAHRLLGDLDEAAHVWQRALDIFESALGPEHPHTAIAINNFALLERARGRLDSAEEKFVRAREIWTRTVGPTHPNVAKVHMNLGDVALARRRFGEAQQEFEVALSIYDASADDAPPQEAKLDLLDRIASLHTARGQHAEAVLIRQSVLSGRLLRSRNPRPNLASAYTNLGLAELELNRPTAALGHFEIAQSIRDEAMPADHPHQAWSLVGRGRALLALGREQEARSPLERAVEIRKTKEPDASLRAEADFALARAIAKSSGASAEDLIRAHELANAARKVYASSGLETQTERVDAWRSANPL